MLIVGAAIVFGSSLMLVTKAWPQWTPTLKYLAIVSYTTVIFLASEFSRRKLRLNATYRVLQSLTLLLLPVCFMSLTWLGPGTAVQDLASVAWHGVLIIPALILLWQASTRILDHWLHARQATFLMSYGLLCVAGAIPAMTSPVSAFAFTMACWCVFTAGVIKVNRHTFWLAESHQFPRVFGFLPIAMLGLQFVVLVATKSVSALPVQWIGFATVLVSATILVTARSVADVIRRRTGDLVRPLPWIVMAPLLGGLILSVLGVGLSLSGFSYNGSTSLAVIPTALIGAAIFGLAARDIPNRFLVWASLVLLTLAYQCSPVMFADLVDFIRARTADAINRERIPVSLYGLTYLPLLGLLAVISEVLNRRSATVASKSIQQFVTTLAVMLQAIAVTDLTSCMFVSIVNVPVFIAYAIAFKDRRYAIASVLLGVLAAATIVPAGNQMQWWQLSNQWSMCVLGGLALLMTVSHWPDRLLRRIPSPSGSKAYTYDWIRWIGYAVACGVGIHWLTAVCLSIGQPLTLSLIVQFSFLLSSLFVTTTRSRNYWAGISFWALLGFALVHGAIGMDVPLAKIVFASTYVSIACASLALAVTNRILPQGISKQWAGTNRGDARLARFIATFAAPLRDVSITMMLGLTAVAFVPGWLLQHVTAFSASPLSADGFGYASLAIVTGMFIVAFQSRNTTAATVASIIAPISVTSFLFTIVSELSLAHVCLVWVTVQGIAIALYRLPTQSNSDQTASSVTRAMMHSALISLTVPMAISCLSFDWLMRLAFVIAASVWTWSRNERVIFAASPRDLAIAVNIQILLVVASVCGCTGWIGLHTLQQISATTITSLLLTMTLSIAVFDRVARTVGGLPMDDWANRLRLASIALAMVCFASASMEFHHWTSFDIVLGVIGLAILAVSECGQAIRKQQEARVWMACGIVAVTIGFLSLNGVIAFGPSIARFALLAIAASALTFALKCKNHQSRLIFHRPMSIIGISSPAVVALLTVMDAALSPSGSPDSHRALALMIAASIYFHQAYAAGRRNLYVHAVVMINLGSLFMWRSLGWSATELWLIPAGLSVLGLTELFRDRLPKAAHDPLRYIAVLTITCSPLFEVLGGSWIHMFSLMLISVVIILIAIGLRLRSLVYAGSACLVFDLVAMVIRSTIHDSSLLWVLGVALGISVIALAAFCENHREKLLSRIRTLTAELATWT
tara:strand:- start:51990 stop:55583 length:3594 start_codon:yes stop_codon:yes gene_type:complete